MIRSAQHTIVNHLHDTQARWFAIHTKYKAEKFITSQLLKQNITAYTPLLESVHRYGKKVKSHQVPLIHNYVFVKITKHDYVPVLETQYVFRFVKQGQHLVCIPDREIQILKQIVGEEYRATLADMDLVIGDVVEVIGGNLTGLTGKLISTKGNHNMLVELENIACQFQIEIDAQLLVKRKRSYRA